MYHQFNEGDEVVYIADNTPHRTGKTGKIVLTKPTSKFVSVKWDDGCNLPTRIAHDRLRLVRAKPPVSKAGYALKLQGVTLSSGNVIAVLQDHLAVYHNITQPIADLRMGTGKLDIIFA